MNATDLHDDNAKLNLLLGIAHIATIAAVLVYAVTNLLF